MRETKTTRKTFLKGLGLAAIATALSPLAASAAPREARTSADKLPMDAQKAPKAVARRSDSV